MSWLTDFYQRHPEYRRLRIAKRSRNSIHFEIEPGKYEAHFLTRPLFERVTSGLWLPIGNLAKAVRMGIALSRTPRFAWEVAKALPFTASPLTLQPDETAGCDTLICNFISYLDYNYGISTAILSGSSGNAGTPYRGLIQFDVSSIPSTDTVDTGVLTLYCISETSTSDYYVGIHRGLTQWFEGDKAGAALAAGHDGSTARYRNNNGSVQWYGNTQNGSSGNDFSASYTAHTLITAPNAAYDWNGLVDIAAWVAGTATNYGWWLIGDELLNNHNKNFASSSGATSSQRPKLVVTYHTPATTSRSFAVIVG